MNALNKGNALKGNPWGSNPKASTRYRKHVTDRRMQGKEPLSPNNWWNANRTRVASER